MASTTTFDVSFNTDNAEFDYDDMVEALAGVLQRVADSVRGGSNDFTTPTSIRDLNGNTIGSFGWRQA
jgi:hypothetical protein